MAAEKKLDCVILGLLGDSEATGYDLKKRIDTALSHFWGASYGSIYPTLGDLVERGLAARREEPDGGRHRIFYRITDAGRAYLREWLTKPVEKDELRYETLLKLFFGKEGSPALSRAHIEAFRHRIAVALEELEGYEKVLRTCLDDDAAHRYYLATVLFGIKTYRAYLEWCDEAEALLGV